MNDLQILSLPEYAIVGETRLQVQSLLGECFPGWFDGRSYVKQLPHFRFLAMEGESVVGQLGVDVRVINVGGTVIPIMGLLDTAVRLDRRNTGIATKLLDAAECHARDGELEFLVLMADRHDLYLKAGYRRIQPAPTKWLAIEDRQTIKVIERDLSDCFMAKPLTDKTWPTGTIDMLGYMF
ncbi:MAG: GNAT family N-acetyltransferase [Planctomycetaceae bacterium]|nr:GNAT family N-acetyltransferase [Planctomycetaceae bacterium]